MPAWDGPAQEGRQKTEAAVSRGITVSVSSTVCRQTMWTILLPSAVHLEERLTVSQSVP